MCPYGTSGCAVTHPALSSWSLSSTVWVHVVMHAPPALCGPRKAPRNPDQLLRLLRLQVSHSRLPAPPRGLLCFERPLSGLCTFSGCIKTQTAALQAPWRTGTSSSRCGCSCTPKPPARRTQAHLCTLFAVSHPHVPDHGMAAMGFACGITFAIMILLACSPADAQGTKAYNVAQPGSKHRWQVRGVLQPRAWRLQGGKGRGGGVA